MVHFYTEGYRSGRAEEMDTRAGGPHSQMRAKDAFVRQIFHSCWYSINIDTIYHRSWHVFTIHTQRDLERIVKHNRHHDHLISLLMTSDRTARYQRVSRINCRPTISMTSEHIYIETSCKLCIGSPSNSGSTTDTSSTYARGPETIFGQRCSYLMLKTSKTMSWICGDGSMVVEIVATAVWPW